MAWLASLCSLMLLTAPATPEPVRVHLVGEHAPVALIETRIVEFTRAFGARLDTSPAPDIQLEDMLEAKPATLGSVHVWIDLRGVDAGRVDAGRVDAGRVDAGRVDAGRVDAGQVDRVRVIIVDANFERVLIRHVALTEGLDEVAIDEIGYIVEISVEALLEGGSIGVEIQELREQTPAPSPSDPRPEAPRAHVQLAAAYLGRFIDGAVPRSGLRLAVLGGSSLRRARLSGGLEFEYLIARRTQNERLALQISGWSLGALARGEFDWSPRWFYGVSVGASVTHLRARNSSRVEGATTTDPPPKWESRASLRTGPGLHIGSLPTGLTVAVEATLDVAFLGARYIDASDASVLLDPTIVRPGVALTLAWRSR